MKKALFLSVILFSLAALAWPLQTPEQFLGFKPGSDRNLAHYSQIKAYFELLSKESPRLKTFTLGKTTMGNDLFMAVISQEANLRELEKYKDITRQLAQGVLEPAAAEQLAAGGKAIVFVTCNIHSTEIASSQMAMELAYRLAAGTTAADRDILQNVILVLFPSVNPDGQIMEVEWYNKTKGTEYEGTGVPVPLPLVRRPRRQPRLVQDQLEGDRADRQGNVSKMAAAIGRG